MAKLVIEIPDDELAVLEHLEKSELIDWVGDIDDDPKHTAALRNLVGRVVHQSRSTCNLIPPGIYEHYKGGKYLVHNICRDEASGAMLVNYQSLEDGMQWSRPTHIWLEEVEYDGERVQRFQLIKSLR